MTDKTRCSDAGFTLIEALVAMVILGLGAVSLLSAAEGYTGRVGDVTERVAARWVAENALAEARLGLPIADRDIDMLGQRFNVNVGRNETDDPDLVAVTFRVRAATSGDVLFILDGFVPDRMLQ